MEFRNWLGCLHYVKASNCVIRIITIGSVQEARL
jgi:hypothetical protein